MKETEDIKNASDGFDTINTMGHRLDGSPGKKLKAFCCRWCGKQFSHLQTLVDHERTHQNDGQYNCTTCDTKYTSKSGLRYHLTRSTDCDVKYQSNKLQSKLNEEHRKKHGCEVCGKKYLHRKSLLEHRNIHFRNRQYKCDKCDAMFETMGGWKKHRSVNRCAFSKSRLKDNGEACKDGVFIPEIRKRFLQKVKQLLDSEDCSERLNVGTGDERMHNIELVIVPELEVDDSITNAKDNENPLSTEQRECGMDEEELVSSDETPEPEEFFSDGNMSAGDSNENDESTKRQGGVGMDEKKPNEPHKCLVCEKVFSRSFGLKKHLQRHTGEKPFLCDACPKSFADATLLKLHSVVHTGEKSITCSECPMRFARRTDLNDHLTVHFNLSCAYCDEKFHSRKTFQRHQNKHLGLRPYKCELCPKNFITNGDKTMHMRTHSNEKRFVCAICSARFKCASALRRHRNIHAPPQTRPVCEVCQKTYSSVQALQRHQQIHRNAKPFQCHVCAKHFRVKDHLTTHLRSHTGEKPFQCTICPRQFVTSGDLKTHIRRHTGERPFGCETCGDRFIVAALLSRHLHLSGHRNRDTKADPIIVSDVKRAT